MDMGARLWSPDWQPRWMPIIVVISLTMLGVTALMHFL